jgi:hypothetical protein
MLGIIELYGGRYTIVAGYLQGKGTARNGDDTCPSLRGKRGQERPEKPNANHSHCLTWSNRTTTQHIHGASEGLAGEWYSFQAGWQWHHHISRCQVIGSISVQGQHSHALAENETTDVAP